MEIVGVGAAAAKNPKLLVGLAEDGRWPFAALSGHGIQNGESITNVHLAALAPDERWSL